MATTLEKSTEEKRQKKIRKTHCIALGDFDLHRDLDSFGLSIHHASEDKCRLCFPGQYTDYIGRSQCILRFLFTFAAAVAPWRRTTQVIVVGE